MIENRNTNTRYFSLFDMKIIFWKVLASKIDSEVWKTQFLLTLHFTVLKDIRKSLGEYEIIYMKHCEIRQLS